MTPAPDNSDRFALDRRAVARSFGAASDTYDAAAALQAGVRSDLLQRLQELSLEPATVLDLGAGTGHGARELRQRFPRAQIVATDIAEPMLVAARRQRRWWRRFDRVAADAYRLPFRNHCFELVFSNLMFQWCDDMAAAFAETRRVLKPGGRLLFTTFGPDTLVELRLAWAEAGDAANHVNRFFDMHDVGDALLQAGFAEPVLDVDRIQLRYPDVRALLGNLKAIGAHNVTEGRARGLTGVGKFKAMTAAYERQRRDDGLPVTYEVIFATAWGGETSAAAVGRVVDAEVRIATQGIPTRRRGESSE